MLSESEKLMVVKARTLIDDYRNAIALISESPPHKNESSADTEESAGDGGNGKTLFPELISNMIVLQAKTYPDGMLAKWIEKNRIPNQVIDPYHTDKTERWPMFLFFEKNLDYNVEELGYADADDFFARATTEDKIRLERMWK